MPLQVDKFDDLKLPIMSVSIGDDVSRLILFNGTNYEPHLENCKVTLLNWDESMGNHFSGYYRRVK